MLVSLVVLLCCCVCSCVIACVFCVCEGGVVVALALWGLCCWRCIVYCVVVLLWVLSFVFDSVLFDVCVIVLL